LDTEDEEFGTDERLQVDLAKACDACSFCCSEGVDLLVLLLLYFVDGAVEVLALQGTDV
jgi:hypothetical protein